MKKGSRDGKEAASAAAIAVQSDDHSKQQYCNNLLFCMKLGWADQEEEEEDLDCNKHLHSELLSSLNRDWFVFIFVSPLLSGFQLSINWNFESLEETIASCVLRSHESEEAS